MRVFRGCVAVRTAIVRPRAPRARPIAGIFRMRDPQRRWTPVRVVLLKGNGMSASFDTPGNEKSLMCAPGRHRGPAPVQSRERHPYDSADDPLDRGGMIAA